MKGKLFWMKAIQFVFWKYRVTIEIPYDRRRIPRKENKGKLSFSKAAA